MGLLDQILGGLAGGARSSLPGGSGAGGGTGGRVLMALLPVVLSMLANRQRAGGAGVAPAEGAGLPGGLGSVLPGGAGGGLPGGLGGLGGLGALLEQFTRSGYGQQANSWVSAGPNEPLPPEALNEVFGREQLARIASQAGVSEDEARTGLSQLLPQVVDELTPQGQMPAQDDLMASLDEYERRLTGE